MNVRGDCETRLTAREQQILALMTQGLPYKHVAEKLHISVYTVGNHLQSIYRKLGAHSTTEAIYKIGRHFDA